MSPIVNLPSLLISPKTYSDDGSGTGSSNSSSTNTNLLLIMRSKQLPGRIKKPDLKSNTKSTGGGTVCGGNG